MKLAVLIAAAITIATPAMAQTWTTQQFGNQTHYSGTDQNGGIWTGHTEQFGSQNHSTFYGPNGQMTTCTSQQFGSQIHTNCN